jgi:hypothetical protein
VEDMTSEQPKIGKLAAFHIGLAYFLLSSVGAVLIDLGDSRLTLNLRHGARFLAYVLFELVVIYLLLAWRSRSARHAAHVGFCVVWILFLCVSLIFDSGFYQIAVVALATILVWAARFPGEWISQKLNGHAREGTLSSAKNESDTAIPTRPNDLRKARIAIGWSATWALIGLILTLGPMIPIPVLGSALLHASKIIFGLPLPQLAKWVLFAAPGAGLALLAERYGAAQAFPRFTRAAGWCVFLNYLCWTGAMGEGGTL